MNRDGTCLPPNEATMLPQQLCTKSRSVTFLIEELTQEPRTALYIEALCIYRPNSTAYPSSCAPNRVG